MSKHNSKKTRNIFIDVVLVVIFAIGMFYFGSWFYDSWQANQASEQSTHLAKTVVKHKTSRKKQNETSVKNDPGNISINWRNLKKKNPDIIAWIYIPGTKINYPVLQGKDNSYYLTHDLYGKSSEYGEVFMDYRQKADVTNKNTFLYAHNMYDGTKFTELNNYFKKDFFNKHANIYLYTPKKRFDGKVFAIQSNSGLSKAHTMDFENNKQFKQYVNYLKNHSSIKTNVKVKSIKKILTLWTCTMRETTDDDGNAVTPEKSRTFVSVSLTEHKK